MAKIPRIAEKGFVVTSLLLSTTPFTTVIGGSASSPAASVDNSSVRFIWFGLYVVVFLLIFALRKTAIKLGARNKLIWVLIAIALFSTFWSTVPAFTLRRSIALAITTLFGLYIATRYSLEEQLRLLAWALGIASILSLLFAICIPSYGIGLTGAWQGIYNQKNVLARLMVLSSIVFLLLAISARRYRWMGWAMFGLSASLMVLSQSKTSLVNLITLLVLLNVYKILRLHYSRAIPVLIFCIMVLGSIVGLLWSNSEILLSSLGKDATLTGRTELWSTLIEVIWQSPILGYGYSGFWTSDPYGPAAQVRKAVEWGVNNAHNGFLTICIELGLLGLLVYVLGFLILSVRSIQWIRLTKTAVGFWPLTYVAFTFLFNQTESSLISENSIFWIIYTALCFSIPVQHVQASKSI